ncbi:MAG: sulfotransferase [Phycisphaerales bacterium]
MPLPPVDQVIRSATAAYSRGQPDVALLELEQVGPRARRDYRVPLLRGLALSAMSRHDEAIESITRAVDLSPANASRRVILARALQDAGRFENALQELERALALDPKNLEGALLSVAALTSLGRHDEAGARLESIARDTRPERLTHAQRYSLAATIANASPHSADPETAIDALRRVIDEPGELTTDALTTAWSHIGRLLEHLERHDEAFDAFTRMNELHATDWDPEAHSRLIDRMIAAWSELDPAPNEPGTPDASGLVFIVGMMRSGTSLNEQMLAQLDDVTPMGETNHVSRAIRAFEPPALKRYAPTPVRPALYRGQALEKIASGLRAAYGLDAEDRPRVVTDKQPYNFLYLPLIARALPGAKIVHCVRDPVDTCLSCYTQNFADAHPYTARLDWLASYHQDQERLMDAWHALDAPEIVRVRYRDLVSDPAGALAPVLNTLGLDWDPAILSFHESKRAVSTASIHQVRRPLYTSSVGRHQRFGRRLDPLRKALADA